MKANRIYKQSLTLAVLVATAVLISCGGDKKVKMPEPVKADTQSKAADDAKGIGKFTHVEVGPTLDKAMAEAGKIVYDVKCAACHRLNEERLVGPGWKGVSERRTPEWIMNFSTNPDEMLDKDAIAKGMLEECLVRMPNQGLSDDDARNVYEFMRMNDGVK